MSVSVIIAVYNGEKYLAETIESVLAQKYEPIELIIIDDGSTDKTAQIAQKYPHVSYFYQPNRGQPAAQNWALQLAKGAYISFLDADDLYMPDKTTLQVEFLETRPHMDCVFGLVEQFLTPELPPTMKVKLAGQGYLASSGLFRKECFERVGPFNEAQRIGPFIEWYMRATDIGLKHELLPVQTLRRRIHGNNMGLCTEHNRQEYLQLVKAALMRRREMTV